MASPRDPWAGHPRHALPWAGQLRHAPPCALHHPCVEVVHPRTAALDGCHGDQTHHPWEEGGRARTWRGGQPWDCPRRHCGGRGSGCSRCGARSSGCCTAGMTSRRAWACTRAALRARRPLQVRVPLLCTCKSHVSPSMRCPTLLARAFKF